MFQKPWHTIVIVSWGCFAIALIVGYYRCYDDASCQAPSVVSPEQSSYNSLQSKLISDALKRLKSTRTTRKSIVTPVQVAQPLPANVKPVAPQTQDSTYYYEVVPRSFQSEFPRVTVSYNGAQGIDVHDLELIALAIYPFKNMLSKIDTTIFVYYGYQGLGTGIRAFTAQTGKVVNIIAPKSYFRPISDEEWINILRHEMVHVLHDQYLSFQDRKDWEKLIYPSGKVPASLVFSTYAATDEYEALAENVLSYLLLSAEEANNVRSELLPVYNFISSRFDILRLDDRRIRDIIDLKIVQPLGKDATRQINYPLPKFAS